MHLGRALQLTNILRDIAEDAARGRLYLPRELLDEAGVPPDPAAALRHPGLPAVCARVAAMAHGHFRDAARRHGALRPPRHEAGAADGRACTRPSWRRLERRGWARLDVPVKVPKWQKLWIALRHGLAVTPRPCGRRRPGRPGRRGRAGRGTASPRRCTRPGRPPAGAAGRISTARSAAASTTATICCCPATAPPWPTWTRSARAAPWAGRACRAFPFVDLATGERWTVAPDLRRGAVVDFPPRPPRAGHAAARLSRAARAAPAPGRRRRWPRRSTPAAPLYRAPARAAGHRGAEHAAGRGAGAAAAHAWWTRRCCRAARPAFRCFPREGLSESFIDPALSPGCEPRGGRLLTRPPGGGAARRTDGRVTALETADGADAGRRRTRRWCWPRRPGSRRALLPGLVAPDAFQAIVNLHFRIDADPGEAGFIGVLGGTAEWMFVKPGIVSVTISAANRLVDLSGRGTRRAGLAGCARGAAARPTPMPPVRVVKEKPRHLRRHRRAGAAAPAARWPARRAARTTSCSPATGPARACPRRSKVPSGPATPPPPRFSPAPDRIRGPLPVPRDILLAPHPAQLADAVDRARDALLRRQKPDGHWVFELEADATIPAEYVLLEHFLDRIDAGLQAQDRRLSARDPGRAWRLAAVPRRRVRPFGQREGLFRAEDDRRRPGRAAHGARARGHPGRRRGGAQQRVHPRAAGAVRRGAVARGAVHAGGTGAAAALVPVPPEQGVATGRAR